MIEPGKQCIIYTGVIFKFPPGTYGIITDRSGIVTRLKLEVKTKVIDRDYNGTVKVILNNCSKKNCMFASGVKNWTNDFRKIYYTYTDCT